MHTLNSCERRFERVSLLHPTEPKVTACSATAVAGPLLLVQAKRATTDSVSNWLISFYETIDSLAEIT